MNAVHMCFQITFLTGSIIALCTLEWTWIWIAIDMAKKFIAPFTTLRYHLFMHLKVNKKKSNIIYIENHVILLVDWHPN